MSEGKKEEKKIETTSLNDQLYGVEGKVLEFVNLGPDGGVLSREEMIVRRVIVLSLTQGPDMLQSKGKAPLKEGEKFDAHALAVALCLEIAEFAFTVADKALIKKLSEVRLPNEAWCVLTTILDPNAVKKRD